MKLGIINIGDELLIGQIVNTNAQWMSKKMTDNGFEVYECMTIADDAEQIKKTISYLFTHVEVILMSGGLGPTKDDITKKTLCEYYNTELVYSTDVLENIESLWKHRGYPVNELTKTQAFVPKSASIIQNKVGTAPIMYFEHNEKLLVSLPGVPYEMKYNVEHEIVDLLKSKYKTEAYISKNILVHGITESALALHLSSFEDGLPANFNLAYLPSLRLIKLRLSTRGIENQERFDKEFHNLKELLTGHILIADDMPLQAILATKLEALGMTLGMAESCTGGNLSHLITLQQGASMYFKGSVVSYNNEVKHQLLGVDLQVLETKGAVSKEVAEAMAIGAQKQLSASCSIAITGIAGPDGGTVDKPVGTVWISTRVDNSMDTQCYYFGNYREANITAASNSAMIQLVKMLDCIS